MAANLPKTSCKIENGFILRLGVLVEGIWHFLQFSIENVCTLDRKISSIFADFGNYLYINVSSISVGSFNFYWWGPFGTWDNFLWADASALMESQGNLYSEIGKILY